jgi:hypothetical protein
MYCLEQYFAPWSGPRAFLKRILCLPAFCPRFALGHQALTLLLSGEAQVLVTFSLTGRFTGGFDGFGLFAGLIAFFCFGFHCC